MDTLMITLTAELTVCVLSDPYILHSEMRDWTLNAISNRLGNYGSSNQISKEKLITILKPLIPVLEDLAEQEDQYKSDAPKKIIAAIK